VKPAKQVARVPPALRVLLQEKLDPMALQDQQVFKEKLVLQVRQGRLVSLEQLEKRVSLV
jgi:hypothetical protein